MMEACCRTGELSSRRAKSTDILELGGLMVSRVVRVCWLLSLVACVQPKGGSSSHPGTTGGMGGDDGTGGGGEDAGPPRKEAGPSSTADGQPVPRDDEPGGQDAGPHDRPPSAVV